MDEKKTYLVNIESNLKKYADEAAEAKKKVDDLRTANDLLKQSGTASAAEIEANNAALRNAQKEYTQAKKMVDLQTAANSSNINSRKQLGEILNLEMLALGKLGNGMIKNKDGVLILNKAYVEQQQKIANTKKAIIEYDQKLNDGRSNVGRYGATVKAAIGEAAASMFAFAAPIAVATAALNGLKEAFLGTEKGAKLLSKAKLQLSAFFENIVTGNFKYAFGNQLPKDIQKTADLLDEIRIDERKEIVGIAEKELEIKNLRLESVKAGKGSVEQAELLVKAQEKEDELIVFKLGHKQEELDAVNLLLVNQKTNTVLLNKQAELEAEILNIKGEKSLRIATKLQAIEEKQIAATAKAKDKAISDAEKDFNAEQEKIKASQKALQDEVDDYKKGIEEKKAADQKWKDEVQAERERYVEQQFTDAELRLSIREANNENIWTLERDRLALQEKEELYSAEQSGANILLIEQKYSALRGALTRAEQNAKLALYADFAGNLSTIFGENTAIGKAAAIASATISTYLAATEAYASLAGVPVVGPVLGAVAAGAAIAAGIANIKKIIEVKIPGGGGGSSISAPTSISTSVPAQRAFANPVGSTILTQPQLTQSQLNAMPNQNLLTADDIARALSNMPAPVVSVEDINAKIKSKNKVEVRAVI
jgi:hypothetical protein